MKNKISIFLDSGAFSAWSKGVDIDIEKYISFIKDNDKYLEVYSVLDSIGDAEMTLKNQKIMEQRGLNPLPCFHYGEDIKYFEYYLDNYNYISLGGMVPISTKDLIVWLDDLFSNYICGKNGMPKVKIHGFGLTSLDLMLRYPWYSADSTSWVLTGRFGSVFVPRIRYGGYDYFQNAWKICVSGKSSDIANPGKHINTFSKKEREIILAYFEYKGYVLGESDFKDVDKNYKPNKKEGESWFSDKEERKRGNYVIEIIKEPGVMNDYKMRDELNIIYFLDLEKSMPKWPWAFKLKSQKGFDI